MTEEIESTLGGRITWEPGDLLVFQFQCDACQHKRDGLTCDAFPDVIPHEIWMNRHDHREPYPGDNGILFEAKDYGP